MLTENCGNDKLYLYYPPPLLVLPNIYTYVCIYICVYIYIYIYIHIHIYTHIHTYASDIL